MSGAESGPSALSPWGTSVPPVADLLRYFPSVNTAEDDMRWVALTYAEAGWPVFPCKPGEKVPNCPNGFHDATTDPHRIEAWWGRHRHDNIGVPTGVAFDALDVDVKRGQPGLDTLRRLRSEGLVAGAFASATTPSGGLHLLYAPSGDGNHTLPRWGLDMRGLGGYVVVAPSIVGSARYQWGEVVPGRFGTPLSWPRITAYLDPPKVRPNRIPEGNTGRAAGIDALARYVEALPEGNRNAGLYWAARRAVEEGHDPWDLLGAAERTGLSRGEAERTITSAQRGES